MKKALMNKTRNFFPMAQQPLVGRGFMITLGHTTLGRTPLDE
jgi:hypothetical protein